MNLENRSGEVAASGGLPFESLPAELSPHRRLLTYYLCQSLLAGPFFLFFAVPQYFRYRTLRYDMDEEGITMRWGILFRREISLTYARIQDIQLSSNLFERWLGLAKIQLQTASGSASAEMTVEGIREYEPLRDFLYSRMRGARDHTTSPERLTSSRTTQVHASDDMAALTAALTQVADEVRALRLEQAARLSDGHERGGGHA